MIPIINSAIDTIHGAKTNFVKTFAPNDEFKKPLLAFVDAQAVFAKKVAQEANTFFTTVGLAAYTFDVKKAFETK